MGGISEKTESSELYEEENCENELVSDQYCNCYTHTDILETAMRRVKVYPISVTENNKLPRKI